MDIPIDEEIPIVGTHTVSSFIRGYHVYMNVWAAYIDEDCLVGVPETDNIIDPDDVAIHRDDMVNTRVVGHVPLNYAPIFNKFLSLPNHHIPCCVTGKRMNRGGGFGLEVPVDYIFYGKEKGYQMEVPVDYIFYGKAKAIKWKSLSITYFTVKKKLSNGSPCRLHILR